MNMIALGRHVVPAIATAVLCAVVLPAQARLHYLVG